MADHATNLAGEIADLARRLRGSLEIQEILHEDPMPAADARRPRADSLRPAAAASPAPSTPSPVAAPHPLGIVARGPAAEAEDLFAPAPRHSWEGDPSRCGSLGELHDAYAGCLRCALGESRTKFVFGVGNPGATVVFVGEAPGRDEDLQGEPFVGRAGKLLDKILEAIGWSREDVYIANILKCRPPGNRNPEPPEIAACEPILRRQIELIRPVILCTLGSIAAKTVLGTTQGITRLRGALHQYRDIPVVATYHPAALLRNPAWKKPTWEDVQLLRREHDRILAERGASGGSS
jgi:DNA polymerase